MKRLANNIQLYKRIVAVLFALFFTAFIEVWCNYPAIKNGYPKQNLNQYIEEDTDKSNYVVQCNFPEGQYIKQLEIEGKFSRATYTIELVELNDFGKEEDHIITDAVHSWFNRFYTNINKNVTALKIVIPKGEIYDLKEVSISNVVEVNKYRIGFIFISLLLLYGIFFEDIFKKKIEYFFVIFTVLFGSLLLICAQPLRNCWDEEVHFSRVYRMASGRVIEWNEAAEAICNATTVPCNTKAEYAQLRAVMDKKGEALTERENQGNRWFLLSSLPYIPIAIFLRIGMILNLSFSNLYLFGKIGNLLTYVLVMFWAIRLAKRKKIFLFLISIMPTTIFLASSYSYDSTIFSFITLGCVLWANDTFYFRESYKKRTIVFILILLLVGNSSKYVYIPLIFLLFMLPQMQIENRKSKNLICLGIIVSGIAVAMIFLVPLLSKILTGNYSYADPRGGDTSFVGQIFSMLQHPIASLKVFVRDIFRLDNFRNSGNAALNNFFVGNLMFLNYYQLGVMPDKWCLVLIPVMMILLFYKEPFNDNIKWLTVRQQISVGAIIMMAVILVWLSMYLAFTPVGSSRIAGVQARYFLPLIYLIGLLIKNENVYFQINYMTVMKISMLTAWILEVVSIYEFVISSRLF